MESQDVNEVLASLDVVQEWKRDILEKIKSYIKANIDDFIECFEED